MLPFMQTWHIFDCYNILKFYFKDYINKAKDTMPNDKRPKCQNVVQDTDAEAISKYFSYAIITLQCTLFYNLTDYSGRYKNLLRISK